MKILIIGSGGREHAIAKALSKSPHLPTLFVAPGNAGTAQIAQNVPIKDADCAALLTFAKDESIDLTIVGPEGPLVLGLVDLFEAEGLKIVGPNKVAAQLEGSKDWAKSKMKAYGIPTARYETFTHYDTCIAYISKRNTYPIVVKADGLAAGKGVTVAQTFKEAEEALRDCFLDDKFSGAGLQVVIEDFLKGQEASMFAFTDGKTILPMMPAQDHKAVFDGDRGPNTGGMGAYAPAPLVTKKIQEAVLERVFKPLIAGFRSEGILYKGIVYAGLMIDEGELSIVEFNARFGDPETQIVLPLLKTDLVDIFFALSEERLDTVSLDWHDHSAVCVVMASGGYPGSYSKGAHISGTYAAEALEGVQVVLAGVQEKEGDLLTSGGRVLAVVGQSESLKDAIDKAYTGVSKIFFDGAYNRTDIGAKGLV